jgi:hypothetical protein
MPLTEAQMYEVRRWTGDSPSDAELNAAYDRLGSVREVIEETLATRRANLAASPQSFTIPGEYSQSNRSVNEMNALLADLEDSTIDTESGSAPVDVRIKQLVRIEDDGFIGR